MQGWRDKQEDAHICKLDIAEDTHLFCVFDGHGGPGVSQFCEKHFLEVLLDEKTFKDGSDYKLALTEACFIMDRKLRTPEGL
jgi:protein phosphatase 1G